MKAACSTLADPVPAPANSSAMCEAIDATRAVSLVIPGSLDTLTGGYLYDRRIFEGLTALGWSTFVVALDTSFPLPSQDALARARVELARIPEGQLVVIDGLALAGLLPLLPDLVRRLDPVALIHHPLADETGIGTARAAALAAAEQAALALMPRIIVTSPWTRNRLTGYGVDPLRVAVVEPGVEARPVAGREPQATIRLLTVATISQRKGHAVLVAALTDIQDLPWSLRCAGSLDFDLQCVRALRAQIVHAGLSDRVSLLGEIEPAGLHEEYANADLFVLPSYLEGYGMALVEAVAHGLPVVSTRAGAIPDTVPAAAAKLVAPGDVEALASTLRALLSDRAALATLREGARQAAACGRSWDTAARGFADALMPRAVR